MDLKKDIKNMKDDVVKGADKIGSGIKHAADKIGEAVKHTSKDLKDDIKGASIDVGEIAGDVKEKYEETKFAKEIKKQMKKEDK